MQEPRKEQFILEHRRFTMADDDSHSANNANIKWETMCEYLKTNVHIINMGYKYIHYYTYIKRCTLHTVCISLNIIYIVRVCVIEAFSMASKF
jgi:hypothetical protein